MHPDLRIIRCSCLPINQRAFLSAAVLVALILPAAAQVTIEIVNDSGLPDTNVFLKVPGQYWPGNTNQPVTPADLFVDTAVSQPPNPASVALATLATNGSAATYPITSPISGNTDLVYSFKTDYLDSGTIYFTYYQPFNFTNGRQPSPPPDSANNAFRYDYAELSINDSTPGNNAMDITYVDKFGIPLQMEWFRGTNLMAGSYVYASTRTLVNLFTNAGLGPAVFALGPSDIFPGWQYLNPGSYTNFARILAPQKLSAANAYPGVASYLNSLVGPAHAFWLNGASAQKNYYYLGYQVSVTTNAGGWLFTLSPTTNLPPFNPLQFTGSTRYTNTITFTVSNSLATPYIYGAPVGPGYYATNGVAVTTSTGPTYAVEVWMIGDVLSAINFGFWGGAYGTNSADWFSPARWTAFPFGSARDPNDGDYNPYAALIYDNADPYSFAFSERITPDVLLLPINGDRVRITILPDDRLDSPVVASPAADAITTNSITLDWGAVAGATGYQVNVLRPFGLPPVNLSPACTNYTLTGLQPGTPYVVSVQATGTANGSPIITPARPVSATTSGTATPVTGNLTQIQVTFNATDPFYQLDEVDINGPALFSTNNWNTTNGTPARWLAAVGTNQVVVTVVGANHQVLFNDWLTFELAAPFFVTNGLVVTTNSAISNVSLHGQKLSQSPPEVSGFINRGTATNFQVSTQFVSLTIGLSYVPAETRKYAPVVTAGSPIRPPVTILNPTLLPNGGFQFTFNLPAGTNYAVEVSDDLVNWRTNFTGTGLSADESYTNATRTNVAQFYRLKL